MTTTTTPAMTYQEAYHLFLWLRDKLVAINELLVDHDLIESNPQEALLDLAMAHLGASTMRLARLMEVESGEQISHETFYNGLVAIALPISHATATWYGTSEGESWEQQWFLDEDRFDTSEHWAYVDYDDLVALIDRCLARARAEIESDNYDDGWIWEAESALFLLCAAAGDGEAFKSAFAQFAAREFSAKVLAQLNPQDPGSLPRLEAAVEALQARLQVSGPKDMSD